MHHPRRRAMLPAVLLTALALLIGGCGAEEEPGEDTGVAEPRDDDQGADDQEAGEPEDQGGEDDESSPESDRSAGDDADHRSEADDLADNPGEPDSGVNVPGECPAAVVAVGNRITSDFEHVEHPPTEDLAILTCDWRDTGSSIASVEVSFSTGLFGTDLANLDGAREVTVAGVDGYFLHSEERKAKANMFQFSAGGLFITGGSIEVDDVDQGDVLELAEAAIDAVTE